MVGQLLLNTNEMLQYILAPQIQELNTAYILEQLYGGDGPMFWSAVMLQYLAKIMAVFSSKI
jgi:hypothetical protein